MGESDYLDDNLMQKPFSGKEKYIFFLLFYFRKKESKILLHDFD
jgi:hypothetical protein